jgi:hypothetical protein
VVDSVTYEIDCGVRSIPGIPEMKRPDIRRKARVRLKEINDG